MIPRLLLLLLILPAALCGAETLAERSLRDVVDQEKRLFARAEREGDNLDEARFAAEAKTIAGAYNGIISKNPDFAPAFVAYGLFLSKVDMGREAAVILLKANKLDPNLAVVKNQLAKLMAEDGKPLDALPYLMAAIDLEPRESLYHYHLGRLLLAARDDFLTTGNFTRAKWEQSMLEALSRAAELAPNNWEFAIQHAKAYYDLEPPRWAEALGVWEKLGARATTGTLRQLIKLHRANVLILAGRPAEARPLLDEVTDLRLAEEKQRVLDGLAKAGEK